MAPGVHRYVTLKAINMNRMVSTAAALMLGGIVPSDLLVQERARLGSLRRNGHISAPPVQRSPNGNYNPLVRQMAVGEGEDLSRHQEVTRLRRINEAQLL